MRIRKLQVEKMSRDRMRWGGNRKREVNNVDKDEIDDEEDEDEEDTDREGEGKEEDED